MTENAMKETMFALLLVVFTLAPGGILSKPRRALSVGRMLIADCPKMEMDYPDPFDEKAPLKFEVRVKGADPDKKLKYSWFVSKGSVKSGQGTASIIVEAKGADRQGLTATVVICGLPYECENEVSSTTSIAESKSPSKPAPNKALQLTAR
jgi:hypothetical protein